jgi:hypothetical protein
MIRHGSSGYSPRTTVNRRVRILPSDHSFFRRFLIAAPAQVNRRFGERGVLRPVAGDRHTGKWANPGQLRRRERNQQNTPIKGVPQRRLTLSAVDIRTFGYTIKKRYRRQQREFLALPN